LPELLAQLRARLAHLEAAAGSADQDELKLLRECDAQLLTSIADVIANLSSVMDESDDPEVTAELEQLYEVVYAVLTEDQKVSVEARVEASHEAAVRDGILRDIAGNRLDEVEGRLEDALSKFPSSPGLLEAQAALAYCRTYDGLLSRFGHAADAGELEEAVGVAEELVAEYRAGMDLRDGNPHVPTEVAECLARAISHGWDGVRVVASDRGLALFERVVALLENDTGALEVDAIRRVLELAKAPLAGALMDLWHGEAVVKDKTDYGRLFREYTSPRHLSVIELSQDHSFKSKLERLRAYGLILARGEGGLSPHDARPFVKGGVEFAFPPIDQLRRKAQDRETASALRDTPEHEVLLLLDTADAIAARRSQAEQAIEDNRLSDADRLIEMLGTSHPEAANLRHKRDERHFLNLLVRGALDEAEEAADSAGNDTWRSTTSLLASLLSQAASFDLDKLMDIVGNRRIDVEIHEEVLEAHSHTLEEVVHKALEALGPRFRSSLREGDRAAVSWLADVPGRLRTSGLASGTGSDLAAAEERMRRTAPLVGVWEAIHKEDLHKAELVLSQVDGSAGGDEYGIAAARVKLLRLSRSYDHDSAVDLLSLAEQQIDEVAGPFTNDLAAYVENNADFELAQTLLDSEKYYILDAGHRERIRAVALIGGRRFSELTSDGEVLEDVLPQALQRFREEGAPEAIARLQLTSGTAAPKAFEEFSADLEIYLDETCAKLRTFLRAADMTPENIEDGRRQFEYLRDEAERLKKTIAWQKPLLGGRCTQELVDFGDRYPEVECAASGFLAIYEKLDECWRKSDLRRIGQLLQEYNETSGLRGFRLYVMMREHLQGLDARRRELTKHVRTVAMASDVDTFVNSHDDLLRCLREIDYDTTSDLYGLRYELGPARYDTGEPSLSEYLEKCERARRWLEELDGLEKRLRSLDSVQLRRWIAEPRENRRRVRKALKQIGDNGIRIIIEGIPRGEHEVVRTKFSQLKGHRAGGVFYLVKSLAESAAKH
jgi:hypothetical protein